MSDKPDAVDKLTRWLHEGFVEAAKGNCGAGQGTDAYEKGIVNLGNAIRAAIREELLTDRALVRHSEEIVDLTVRVEKMEEFLIEGIEIDCTPDESEATDD